MVIDPRVDDYKVRANACQISEKNTQTINQECVRAKSYQISVGTYLHEDHFKRCIEARVGDTAKRYHILGRIHQVLRTQNRELRTDGPQALLKDMQNELATGEMIAADGMRHSLQHFWRLYIGPRKYIINAILQMTFDEFRKYTHMYPSDMLYKDSQAIEKQHKYIICDPGIWPPNLYIRLKDLKEYLQRKGVNLRKMDLRCITPVLLHWSDLMTATNFDQCVQYDYYKAEGKTAMSLEMLAERREDFYTRCWEAGEWIWRAPDVTDADIKQQMVQAKAVIKEKPISTSQQETTMQLDVHVNDGNYVDSTDNDISLNPTNQHSEEVASKEDADDTSIHSDVPRNTANEEVSAPDIGEGTQEELSCTTTPQNQDECIKNLRIRESLTSTDIDEAHKILGPDLFCQYQNKHHSWYYNLRLKIGPKQYIINAILQMTFEEFCKYTQLYFGDIMYGDTQKMETCYKNAICDPGIWPPNLYIRLKDLKEYLQRKGMNLRKMDLRCITPVLLHWSDLMTATNFDKCVQYDYYKAEGKTAMSLEMLAERREDFYKRCWEAGEWIWRAPDVTDPEIDQQFCESMSVKGTNDTTVSPIGLQAMETPTQTNGVTTEHIENIELQENASLNLPSTSQTCVIVNNDDDINTGASAHQAKEPHQKPMNNLYNGTRLHVRRPLPKRKKERAADTYVPQVTHQYRPLTVDVEEKSKGNPTATHLITPSSADVTKNNNNNNVSPTPRTTDWTPSQLLANDNTLFNITSLLLATTENTAESKDASNSTKETKARPAVVIDPVNSEGTLVRCMQPPEVKTIFFHELIRFDYYKSLTYDQIQRDFLHTTRMGKRYMQARINYGRCTTVHGDFLKTLLPHCSPSLLNDLKYVLANLGEYHYNIYDRRSNVRICDDQRKRIIEYFLQTRPLGSFCQLKFDSDAAKYAKCKKRVDSYANSVDSMRPRRSLASAIQPHILDEIKLLKLKLNK